MTVPAHRLNQRWSKSVDWTRPRRMEGLRAGRRIIGEVAGHEIHLEIEDVQDKKNA